MFIKNFLYTFVVQKELHKQLFKWFKELDELIINFTKNLNKWKKIMRNLLEKMREKKEIVGEQDKQKPRQGIQEE